MRTTALLAIGAVALAAPAQAQMISPMLYEGPRISLQAHAQRSAPTPADRAAPAPDRGAVQLTYRPDLARRKANLARFVARTRAVDPAGADQLAAAFAATDFIGEIARAGAPYGLHIDNVADAYATYWIGAWYAARGRNDTPSRAMLAAVRAQAARAIGETAVFRGANDATRQELAEALWIQAALLDVSVEQSKGKPEALKAIGAAALQGARGMGIDLSAMTLTEAGFVPARG